MKKRFTRYFTEEDLQRIEHAVGAAEKKTSGEIVTVIVPQSARYGEASFLWAFLGVITASLCLAAGARQTHWEPTFVEHLTWQIGGGVIGFFLSFFPGAIRWVVPKRWQARAVHREALAHFTALDLASTRHRTGILIYISELEHRVEILADRAIHQKVGQAFWEKEVRTITEAMRASQPAEGISRAIHEAAVKLTEHFPLAPQDADELKNEVRLGIQELPQEQLP